MSIVDLGRIYQTYYVIKLRTIILCKKKIAEHSSLNSFYPFLVSFKTISTANMVNHSSGTPK